jgi:muramoyltetrapeptide carboxypeptidase
MSTSQDHRIKPPALPDGGTIGILSPSKWAETENMETAGKVLEKTGYQLVWGETTRARENQFAGSSELRARELEHMVRNPDIDAVFCVRGGYGAFRVSDVLDYKLIQTNPKIFMGFSDITTLLLSITQRTGLVTFHGPMLHTFFRGPESLSMGSLQGVLSGRQNRFDLGAIPGVNVLKEGVAQGELWGGNIFLVTLRTGTSSQLETRQKILFLEDVNEPLHKLESMFQHLRRSGQLDEIVGLIVGEITDVPEEEVPFGMTVKDIVLDACYGLDIPIISGVPCGHGKSILTFPLSIPVNLQAESTGITLQFLEPAVET